MNAASAAACQAPAVSGPAALREVPARPGRQRLAHASRYGLQRRRIVAAMAELAADHGRGGAGMDRVVARAGVSKSTFYELFTDLDECFVAAIKHAFDRLFAAIAEANAATPDASPDRRAATTIAALVGFLDQDRETARLCLVEVHSGNRVALAIRNAAVHRLAHVLADGFELEDEAIRDATARGAIGAIVGLLQSRLIEDPEARLDDLAWSAIYMALAPFTDRELASAWAERPPPIDEDLLRRSGLSAPEPTLDEQLLFTELARMTLLHLESHPGSRNIDVARAVGVRHESQISRHLVRLERAGVVARRRRGRVNAWRLTDRGHEAARALRTTNRQDRSEASGSVTPSLEGEVR